MEKKKSVKIKISFAVLTGGLSTRFGSNKLTHQIENKSILDIVLEVLPPSFPQFIIGEKHTEKQIQAYDDIQLGKGPIRGIYTALKKIDSDYVFILGGDMPFIERSLIDAMVGLTRDIDADVFVPINKGFFEPLCAIYSRKIIPTVEVYLKKDLFKISELFQHLNIYRIEEDFWKKYDADGESFVNINRQEDLKSLNGNNQKGSG